MKKALVLLLLVFSASTLLTLDSCSKSAYFDAYVKADPGGCEWLLTIDGNDFVPVGLRDGDLYDGAKVTIQYTISAVPYKCVDNKEYPVASITKFL